MGWPSATYTLCHRDVSGALRGAQAACWLIVHNEGFARMVSTGGRLDHPPLGDLAVYGDHIKLDYCPFSSIACCALSIWLGGDCPRSDISLRAYQWVAHLNHPRYALQPGGDLMGGELGSKEKGGR